MQIDDTCNGKAVTHSLKVVNNAISSRSNFILKNHESLAILLTFFLKNIFHDVSKHQYCIGKVLFCKIKQFNNKNDITWLT